MEVKQNFIAGEWRTPLSTSENVNPSDIADMIGHYAVSSTQDVTDAISSAKHAFKEWSRSTSLVRAEALDIIGTEIVLRKDELGDMLAREEGKTLKEATAEAHRAGSLFKFFA